MLNSTTTNTQQTANLTNLFDPQYIKQHNYCTTPCYVNKFYAIISSYDLYFSVVDNSISKALSKMIIYFEERGYNISSEFVLMCYVEIFEYPPNFPILRIICIYKLKRNGIN